MFFLTMHTFCRACVNYVLIGFLICAQIAQSFCEILNREFGQVYIISPLVSQNDSTHYQLVFIFCYIYFDVDIGYLVGLGC